MGSRLVQIHVADSARVAELVDAADLKSADRYGRAGSIPASGTILLLLDARNSLSDNRGNERDRFSPKARLFGDIRCDPRRAKFNPFLIK